MASRTTPQMKKQINNLCAKIKARYPHLYEETGGKYVRRTLLSMLEANAPDYAKAPTPYESSAENDFVRSHARVVKHSHLEQQAA